LLCGLVSSKVLLELSLSLDVIASKVLLIGVVNCDGTEDVKDDTATDVEGHRVLKAIVPHALET
jgi:hypothetical protein